MKNFFYLILILTAFNVKAQQSYSITGTVNDEKGGTVPGATVFITNSKFVMATNSEGKFYFYNIPPGSYEVVIKMLGLNPAVKEITVRDKPVHITAILTESTTTLNTVNINAKKKTLTAAQRANYLQMFLKNFIGETVNAEKCKLLNPKVLNYQHNNNTRILRVTADDFLLVENKALGYNIKYLLTSFELDPKNNNCYYKGYPYFVEMQGTRAQQKKWEENRRLAYLSSRRHFFRAFANNTLKEEGYLVYLCTNLLEADNSLKYLGWSVRLGKDKALLKHDTVPDSVMHTAIPFKDATYLFIASRKDHKQIIFTPEMISKTGRTVKNTAKIKDTVALKYIYVVYLGEKQSPLFYKTGVPIDVFPFLETAPVLKLLKLTPKLLKDGQISMLRPLADTVTINANGGLTPLKGFMDSGYWGWQRLADLTPLDYFVDPVKAQQTYSIADTMNDEKDKLAMPMGNLENADKNPVLKSSIAAIDTLRSRLPIEKLYLQTDKPYYILGDTLRFKSYLLDADYLKPSTRSGLVYVELDDAAGTMVKRMMVPVVSGISWNNIVLDEKDVSEGSYTIRAYTNWMRNFDEDYIFKKNIYISASNSNSTLVKAEFNLDTIGGKNKVQSTLRFTNLDKDALRLKDLQLRLINGRHTVLKDKVTTGMDGSVQLNFGMTDKTSIKNLVIQVNQIGKGVDTATLTIPVILNRPEHIDLQFMPEGGNLVAGIKTKVGFKAIGEDGKAANVSGKILNSKQQEITTFQSLHKGMGSFELVPEAGESYTAMINLPNKTTKSYALPKVSPDGTTLRITPKGDDSLQVVVSLKSEVLSPKSASTQDSGLKTSDLKNYYLIGQVRGMVCYAATVNFKGQSVTKVVSKDLFPAGIARFTLLNADRLPVNERIVYINHNDNLQVSITPNKANYTLRDSIALNIQVKDKEGRPVHSDFALVVTDDSQVRPDSVGSNILNNLLFTSDLKGYVEEPGWYFTSDDNKAIKHPDSPDSYRDRDNNKAIALDNLLLTQGWVGYSWKDIFNPVTTPPKFPAEKQFTVQGKVTNVFNKPIKKTEVSILQKRPGLVMDTLTDDEGRFAFKGKNLYPSDSAYYLVQAKNKNGNAFNVGVDVDGFIDPVFAAPKEQSSPWYVNSDTVLLNNAGTKIAQLKAEANYRGEKNLLKTVTIKDTRLIPGSKNPYGYADIVLDEKDMNAAKKMTLYELLLKRYKNFYKTPFITIRGHTFHVPPRYVLLSLSVVMYIDGQRAYPMDLYMDYLTAEDIRGIEMIKGVLSIALYVTTYSGHGLLYLKHIPGEYIYKPPGAAFPKDFYRPRYTVKNSNVAMGTDLRSTIHWEPNVITDKDGKATVSFFSADKPADYTVVMEGIDLNGDLGYKRQKIKVASTTIAAK